MPRRLASAATGSCRCSKTLMQEDQVVRADSGLPVHVAGVHGKAGRARGHRRRGRIPLQPLDRPSQLVQPFICKPLPQPTSSARPPATVCGISSSGPRS